MATNLLYLEDFDVVACDATVTDTQTTEDGHTDVVLDQTCFYPRGGGQDWDTGTIGDFVVEEVRLDEHGAVHHVGHGSVGVGDTVHCQVDSDRRSINTRLHSAGHLLDMAVSQLHPDWVPGKGAHYPHMSFVEYAVPEGTETSEAVITDIKQTLNMLSNSDFEHELRFVDKQELTHFCRHVPDNIPANKPTRIVLYAPDFGIPCGGTHVRRTSDIGDITITKLKVKKGIAKVSYAVAGIN